MVKNYSNNVRGLTQLDIKHAFVNRNIYPSDTDNAKEDLKTDQPLNLTQQDKHENVSPAMEDATTSAVASIQVMKAPQIGIFLTSTCISDAKMETVPEMTTPKTKQPTTTCRLEMHLLRCFRPLSQRLPCPVVVCAIQLSLACLFMQDP